MKINCSYSKLVEIESLIPNPKNPNKHPERQIKMLSKIIDFQGQRSPIVISNLSGFITKGHGRLEAIKLLGWDKVAVDYQDYESDAQEYADIIADNKIAAFSIIDDSILSIELKLEMFKDFDLELLGFDEFEASNLLDEDGGPLDASAEWEGMPEFTENDKTAYRSIIIHMKDEDAVEKFRKLIALNITDKTKYIWFPFVPREDLESKRFE